MIWRSIVLLLGASLLSFPSAAEEPRDASHAFDPEFGNWSIHVRRLLHPLSHANDWATADGTKTVTPTWGGKADVAEVNAEGGAGHLHFIALRLYNPTTHQWSLNFTSAGEGTFDTPLYGEAHDHDGSVEFIGPDVYKGRHILVRFVSREGRKDRASSEQYFSDDGGHTWELNWVNEYRRLPAAPANAADASSGEHDFDFALGSFHTHIRRLTAPLTGSDQWAAYEGTKTDVPILGDTGSLEQIEADGPSHLELMTIRLYDAKSHQWSLYFANSGSGELATTPSVGGFQNGVGTFLDQEDFKGRTILVRQLWSGVTSHTYHFEQAFSADFGKSWEANFVADLERVKG